MKVLAVALIVNKCEVGVMRVRVGVMLLRGLLLDGSNAGGLVVLIKLLSLFTVLQ